MVQTWLQSYFLKHVEVNAVVYEYTGFGESNGRIPAETSLYDDIDFCGFERPDLSTKRFRVSAESKLTLAF